MCVKLYGNPKSVGWLGWIEDKAGIALGYIPLGGGCVIWMGGIQRGSQ